MLSAREPHPRHLALVAADRGGGGGALYRRARPSGQAAAKKSTVLVAIARAATLRDAPGESTTPSLGRKWSCGRASAQHEIQQMRHRLELNAIPKLELDAESGAERGDAEGGGGGGSDAAAFDELSAMQGEQIQLSTAVLLLRLLTPRSALCLSQRRCWPPLRCC